MVQRTIMVVGCHPDDIEIGMGGTVLMLLDKGYEVTLVDLTNGEPTPHGTVETRMHEAECARVKLGAARRITMDMPNRFLIDCIEYRKKLAAVIREIRPEIIFCQWHIDNHPDHKAANDIVEGARFYAKLTKSDIPGEPFFPSKVFNYFCSHARVQMDISFIIDISPYFEQKLEVIGCYESQIANRPMKHVFDHIQAMNHYWGRLMRVQYGEPFYSKELIGLTDFNDMILS